MQEGAIDPKRTIPHAPQSDQFTPPAYETPCPVHIVLLGSEAIVLVPNTLAQLIQHTGGPQCKSAVFLEFVISGYTFRCWRSARLQATSMRDTWPIYGAASKL